MADLHLWGRANSINVRKVMLCLQWLGLEHRRTDAGMAFGVVNSPQFLAMNPNSLVPVLQHGDFTLWESNVIVRYLCAQFSSGKLYPTELKARFDAERWMDWQQTTLNRAGGPAFKQWIRTPPDQRDPALIAQSCVATVPLWRQIDSHLTQQPCMAGAYMTMADLVIAVEVHRWFGLPQPESNLDQFPALKRWYSPLESAPQSQGVLDQALS
jgi:glutathione S-transferase